MPPDTHFTARPDPPPGLPPVTPPSGKFIAQLFLVPGLLVVGIVVIIVLVPLGYRWLLGTGAHTPEQFLANLDRSNPEVRWRAAEELARVLLRDEQLASDPRFALDLADRLRKTLDTNDPGEKALAEIVRKLTEERPGGDPAAVAREREARQQKLDHDRRALEADRNYILYLSACLGNFSVPVGVPLLRDLAEKEDGAEAKLIAVRRRQVLFSLASLGENLKRFDKLPQERRDAVLEELEGEAGDLKQERGRWAKTALDCLNERRAGWPNTHGVAAALVKCARDEDPFLRETAAFAMNFWEGTPQENESMEKTLLQFTYDNGRGDELIARFYEEENRESQAITKIPGLGVRYNATVALARRGSDKLRMGLLKEMLDEPLQLEYHLRVHKDGSKATDEATAYQTVITALQAVAELHRKQPRRDFSQLSGAVDILCGSSNKAVQKEAKETRIELDKPE